MKKLWTHEERQKLKNEYSSKTVAQLASELNVSENSVRKQVQYLRKRGWTFAN
jgi:biotin operon repressor